MSTRFPNPAPQFFYNGTPAAPLSGGLMYFYVAGSTLTPKDTYSDNGLSTPNANPVVLSSSGVLPNVFLNGSYRVILKDKDGVQQWDKDSVNSLINILGNAWDSTITYGLGGTNIVYGSDGIYYVSIQANNLGHDPAAGANPTWWKAAFDYFAIGQTIVAAKSVAVGNATTGLAGVSITSGQLVIGDSTNGIAGLNTVTKGSIPVGNGSATTAFAVGSNGTILYANSAQSNGVEWAAPPSAITNIQSFPGSGTWTKPAGAVSVLIEIWAGGGGGQTGATTDSVGGGGGGFASLLIAASACGATESVTIGAGGAAGSAGGDTTFGSLATARGGRGGSGGTTGGASGDYVLGSGASAGVSSWASASGGGVSGGNGFNGGDCIMGGAGGGGGSSGSAGSGGGSKQGGAGGAGRTTAGTATAGSVPGGGGGGAYNGTGGAGGAGLARITSW